MQYEIKNSNVLKVEGFNTNNQNVIIKEFFDKEFHTKLTTNKQTITNDGTDTATITVSVYNYLNEAQTAWTGDVVFVLDGIEQLVPTTNGVTSIVFNTSVTGEYTFTTNIPKYRNGEVKVVAE